MSSLHPALILALVTLTLQSWVTGVSLYTGAIKEAQALIRLDKEIGAKGNRITKQMDYIFWPCINLAVTLTATLILAIFAIWG